MARGYPEPKEQEEKIPRLVPQGVCVICKKRPSVAGDTTCAPCRDALARP